MRARGVSTTTGSSRRSRRGEFGAAYPMPAPLTSLIGRQTELAEAVRCLLDPDVRLLTLTGAPVSGKTRLAVAVAEAVQTDFRHGVWFVPLAALQHSDLVLPTIAHILQPLGGARGVIASVDRVLWAEDEAPPGPTDHAERRVPRARGDLLVEDMQELGSTSAIMRRVAESGGELEPDFGGAARGAVTEKSGSATVLGGAP